MGDLDTVFVSQSAHNRLPEEWGFFEGMSALYPGIDFTRGPVDWAAADGKKAGGEEEMAEDGTE